MIELMIHANPTGAQLACLIEMTNRGSERAAAAACGMAVQTLKNHVTELYARIDAHNRTEAVVILWPVIGEALLPDWPRRDVRRRLGGRIAVDRRLGRERRGAA